MQRQAAAAQKAKEAQRPAALFSEILSVHQQEFAPAERPVAPPPVLSDESKIRAQHERVALQGIGLFKRAERAATKQRAAAAAASDFAALKWQAEMDAAQARSALDQQWQQLLSNDPDTVIATLAEAFEDNEAPNFARSSRASIVRPRDPALAVVAVLDLTRPANGCS